MITQDILTLEIHKLTQAQFDSAAESGSLSETALYLTPEEAIDLTIYATRDGLDPTGAIEAAGGIIAWINANYDNAEEMSY